MMLRFSARNFIVRFLDDVFLRSLALDFLHCWIKQSASASITIFWSSASSNYLLQSARLEAISFIFILLVRFVTPPKVGLHHFCVALMVTHKFRLCLHPQGSSVSSRYTFPIRAWLGVFCFSALYSNGNYFVQIRSFENSCSTSSMTHSSWFIAFLMGVTWAL